MWRIEGNMDSRAGRPKTLIKAYQTFKTYVTSQIRKTTKSKELTKKVANNRNTSKTNMYLLEKKLPQKETKAATYNKRQINRKNTETVKDIFSEQ